MVRHKGELHDRQHQAIVDETTWQSAQDRLDGNGGDTIARRRAPVRCWFDGKLFDRYGRPMKSGYGMRTARASGVRQSKHYWYNVSKPEGADDNRAVERMPADGIDALIVEVIRHHLGDCAWVASSLDAA
ncbi:MAG: hypothetical protein AAGK37_12460 [Pseudomonadota bacterium]